MSQLKYHCFIKFQYLESTEFQDLGKDILGKHGILDQLGKLKVDDTLTQGKIAFESYLLGSNIMISTIICSNEY